MAEDIKLFEESLKNPKKWACISRKIPGRNQHMVKNRFIGILSNETGFSRKNVAEVFLQNEDLLPLLMRSVDYLDSLRRTQQRFMQENRGFY